MDLSPEALCQPVIREEKVAAEINMLAGKIASDPENYKLTFELIVADVGLTKPERNEICSRFVDSGWADVTHKTSVECGERGGLVVYTFHKPVD